MGAQEREEFSEQWDLASNQLASGLCEREPRCTVHLGEFPHHTGTPGPLHAEGIAFYGRGIAIPLHGERVQYLSAGQLDRRQSEKPTLREQARFLLKFTSGGGKRGFLIKLPFRDGPCTFVLSLPERTTHMSQEDLDRGMPPPEDE